MKITRNQLNELIRYITQGVVKEYGMMSGQDQNQSSDPGMPDDGVKPMDAMTAAEKSKANREARQNKVKQVQQAQKKLDGDKAQDDYFAKQRETNRTSIKAQEKDLQRMKGARVSSPVSSPASAPVSK